MNLVMRSFFKKKTTPTTEAQPKTEVSPEASAKEPKPQGFFKRLKDGLSKTRTTLTSGMGDLFLGKKAIDESILEELETHLIMADVGVEATQKILGELTSQVARKELVDSEALMQALQAKLRLILDVGKPMEGFEHQPLVILMVGVNGNGKTTTIGKLAKRFQAQGKTVMLAAGDTFRAAAIEQLQAWGERNNIPVVAQQKGADSAAVAFDALQAAKSRGVDVLIVDTAGRLHTQQGLMDELKKVKRVLGKVDEQAPQEVLLVLDAATGQNALVQAQEFHQAIGINGIVLTKLDGTAKGGITFAIAHKMQLPIRYIGVGEGIDDLQPFDGEAFVAALFAVESEVEA